MGNWSYWRVYVPLSAFGDEQADYWRRFVDVSENGPAEWIPSVQPPVVALPGASLRAWARDRSVTAARHEVLLPLSRAAYPKAHESGTVDLYDGDGQTFVQGAWRTVDGQLLVCPFLGEQDGCVRGAGQLVWRTRAPAWAALPFLQLHRISDCELGTDLRSGRAVLRRRLGELAAYLLACAPEADLTPLTVQAARFATDAAEYLNDWEGLPASSMAWYEYGEISMMRSPEEASAADPLVRVLTCLDAVRAQARAGDDARRAVEAGVAACRAVAEEDAALGLRWSVLDGSAATSLTLGCLAAQRGELELAERWLERCLAIEPGAVGAQWVLARVSERRGDVEAALVRYHRCLTVADDRPRCELTGAPRRTGYEALGVASCLALGRLERARGYLVGTERWYQDALGRAGELSEHPRWSIRELAERVWRVREELGDEAVASGDPALAAQWYARAREVGGRSHR